MKKFRGVLVRTIGWMIIGVLMVFTVYPVIYALVGSLKTNAELQGGANFFPRVPQWGNYYQAYIKSHFLL